MTATAEPFDLQAFLAQEGSAVERALERVAQTLLRDVPESLGEPIRYALRAGGKRLRPILCVAAYRAVRARVASTDESTDEPGKRLYELAAALELIHGYSLVHDDLPCMDDDDLRRGSPTTHRVYGEARAVLAGAALIPLTCEVIERSGRSLGLSAERRVRIVRELCTAAGAAGMVGGQQLDLEAEGQSVTLETLETLHRSKTGALLTAALSVGGMAAQADEAALSALRAYGGSVGLAFQIADDLLDITGRSAVLGKTAGRDLELGKATFPSLMGNEAARRRANEEVEAGIAAVRAAGLATMGLEALARYAVDRDR